jgi:hypothetical protein
MGEIRTKPSNEKFRKGFERTFRKSKCSRNMNTENNERDYVDWGEFKTNVCVTKDPHFGG